MASLLQLAPKVTHARIVNHLWTNKKPWIDPNNTSPSLTKQSPAIKKLARFGYDKRYGRR